MALGRRGGRAQLDPGDTPVCSAPQGRLQSPDKAGPGQAGTAQGVLGSGTLQGHV